MTAFPPVARPGRATAGGDPAAYTRGRTTFARPTLRVAPNGPIFEFPGGVEGIRVSGSVGIAEHLYLGDNAPVVQVVHRDSRRIELRGMFVGTTGAQNMRDLLAVITSPIPQGYWILNLPATLFPKEQQVVIENYDYDHPEDDRNDSFAYQIQMVRTGVGAKVSETENIATQNQAGTSTNASSRGITTRTFTTRSNAETLRSIATAVYGDPDKWREVYDKNKDFFSQLKLPLHQVQYVILGPGLKLNV